MNLPEGHASRDDAAVQVIRGFRLRNASCSERLGRPRRVKRPVRMLIQPAGRARNSRRRGGIQPEQEWRGLFNRDREENGRQARQHPDDDREREEQLVFAQPKC